MYHAIMTKINRIIEKSKKAALSILKEKGFDSNLTIRQMIDRGRKY